MPSGERNQYQSKGLDYGASVAGENVEFAGDSNMASPGGRDRALLDKLKDALKPGDTRRPSVSANRPSGDTTHDGRHGGIEDVMQPGNRDYDEREEVHRGGVLDELGDRSRAQEGRRRGSILDTMNFGHGQRQPSVSERQDERKSGGIMDALGRKSEPRRHEEYRDSSNIKKSDEHRFPGSSMYEAIRDDLL
ncbi:hypothetical protein NUW58_g6015 [Xylaria curta]|uniref:Uncharacterized protein n=1 Tax=Xylaria curta TaxID=42375 RepID=A0ACC1P1V9_9PEZI|nr:hypothetical protein NUW58_g6015 [Xylaria curta]